MYLVMIFQENEPTSGFFINKRSLFNFKTLCNCNAVSLMSNALLPHYFLFYFKWSSDNSAACPPVGLLKLSFM